MNNDEYRKFWERFLGRYPDFKPTKEQTEDWRRELQYKDKHILEAAVATVVKEKSSVIPRLPWIESAYYRVKESRAKDVVQPTIESEDEYREKIKRERVVHMQQLKETPIDELREATRSVLKRYAALDKPSDGNVEGWSKYLRACVWVELYGATDVVQL